MEKVERQMDKKGRQTDGQTNGQKVDRQMDKIGHIEADKLGKRSKSPTFLT
jgi:hypothetical protein